MLQRLQDSVAASVFQATPQAAQLSAAGAAVVLTALWTAFTGVLALVMVMLFACDLGLGVLKSVHVGGMKAFDHDRFFRAFMRLGAGFFAVLLAVCVDLVLREVLVLDATYATSGVLGAVCFYFAMSAGQSLDHFFPGVGASVRGLLYRVRDPRQRDDGPPEGVEDRRRS